MMSKKLIVTMSWDDNSPENLKLAELLYEYGVKATFYICAERDNLGNAFNESDVQKIQKIGFEIGSHSSTHPDLTRTADLKSEIFWSKRQLETRLDCKVNCFCYPYNRFNNTCIHMVRSSGYRFARTANHSYLHSPEDYYKCPVTLYASNHSPLQAAKLIILSAISPLSIFDWEKRAILVFEKGLKTGGIWHLYGHSWEIKKNQYWDKLEEVLDHISGRKDVGYLNNFEAWASAH
jgi:peptidoglycan/xylan/chitin deacetylase (PgdA/CDA1 family)